jgi:hypothetical protein
MEWNFIDEVLVIRKESWFYHPFLQLLLGPKMDDKFCKKILWVLE